MEVLPIITVAELEETTLNDELIELCQSQPYNASKIINQVSIRLRNKIDKGIFLNEDTNEYEIPEDLKWACASLCESLFICNKEKNTTASKKVLSEKIDDYSITYSDSTSAYTFFGIPADSDIIAVIEAYSGITGKGYRYINLH